MSNALVEGHLAPVAPTTLLAGQESIRARPLRNGQCDSIQHQSPLQFEWPLGAAAHAPG